MITRQRRRPPARRLLSLLLLASLLPRLQAFLPATPTPPILRHPTTALHATTPPPTHILVIGAGVGGLATAGRLARATKGQGTTITIVEKNGRERVGGRLNEYVWEGHRWETGPSLLLLPEVYAETFAALGGEVFLPLTKVEPSYLVVFGDGDSLELYTDRTKMEAAIERLEPGAFPQYQAYLDGAQANLDFGFSAFIEEKPRFEFLPAFLQNALGPGWPLQGHHSLLANLFNSRKLQAALSFQDLYVGLSPYDAPAVFSLLQAIELNQGVFYPKGGFAQVAREMLRLVEEENGVQCLFDTPVEEILVSEEEEKKEGRRKKKKKATGVRLKDGRVLAADLVISNVDAPFTNKYLLPPTLARPHDHDRKQFSSSVVSFLWALDKPMLALRHHSTFLAASDEKEEEEEDDAAKAAWEGLFTHNRFDPTRFNFYVHAPARTDPSVCPPGHDAIMVLVPCPVLGIDGEEEEEEEEEEMRLVAAAKEAVLQRFEKMNGMEEFRRHIIHERVIAPREWRETYSLSRGAVFGLRHNLGQLSLLRPGPRSGEGIGGLYHCGASNRPGNGVPLVMVGAKLLSEMIVKEHYS